MIMFANEKRCFTPKVQRRWDKIPKWAQERILDNVFYGGCLSSVPINLQSVKMKKDMLALKGTCKKCGRDIVRVVEPEGS